MLNAKKKKCIILMVANDMTQKQIAAEIGVSEATICNWKKDIEFMTEYNEVMKESMLMVAAKAFNTMNRLLSARSEKVRLLAAKDLLDRAGFKPTDKMDLLNTQQVVFIHEDLLED